jgi:nifR3 family TIM-barrel protein
MAESRIPQLAPLRLGRVVIDFPVTLAALSGYSDWPMRTLSRRMGAGYALCEVLLDQFFLGQVKDRHARLRSQIREEEHPVGAQLLGSDPAQVATAAARLAELGFDAVDLNLGCPVRKTLGRCRGGYLLGHPEIALEMIARVRDVVPPEIPVTIKMRSGLDDSPASRDHFFAIFDGAFACGVAAVTVHPRTVRQRYEGSSSWEFLRQVKEHAGTRVVIGSGDLFSAQDCFAMMAQTGVDGVSVARGAIGNPWIFQQARALAAGLSPPGPPSLAEQRGVIAEHWRLAEETYGAKRACLPMRKVAARYARLHPQTEAVRQAFVAVREPSQWPQVLDRWYGPNRSS